MICNNCKQYGLKAEAGFTKKERVHLLASVAAMARGIIGNINAPEEDKVVSSSVTTKLLLSFDDETREGLLKYLRQMSGVEIKMADCGHNN